MGCCGEKKTNRDMSAYEPEEVAPARAIHVWFDDGTSHEIEPCEEAWNALPYDGILIVKEVDRKPNALVHMGMDYIWLEDGEVKHCRMNAIDRYIIRPQGIRNVKLGRWCSDEMWQRVHDEAMAV